MNEGTPLPSLQVVNGEETKPTKESKHQFEDREPWVLAPAPLHASVPWALSFSSVKWG